jgi:hypothetical protein
MPVAPNSRISLRFSALLVACPRFPVRFSEAYQPPMLEAIMTWEFSFRPEPFPWPAASEWEGGANPPPGKARHSLGELEFEAAPPRSAPNAVDAEAAELAWEWYYGNNDEQEFEQRDVTSAPTLLKSEKAADGETLYGKIGLGMGKTLAYTGIYVPNSFRADSDIVVVVYLHGHKGAYPGNAVLINGYWDGTRFPFFALREEVNASGQNVIFVAPSLGPLSQAGSLSQKGRFDTFMEQVLPGLNEHYLMPRHGRRIRDVQSIILAAHSGGGSPMLNTAKGTNRYAVKIKECWCFDSMYGPVAQAWVGWAKSHPKASLYIYYGPAKGQYNSKKGEKDVLPRDNAEAIACASKTQGLTNVCVQPFAQRR